MSATNRGSVRSPGDFYETPAWCVEGLLEAAPWIANTSYTVLDAGCGTGAIAKVLKPKVGMVLCVDNDPERIGTVVERNFPHVWCTNYLSVSRPWAKLRPQLCVMNPPYSLAAEFVAKAREECCYVYALLRVGFVETPKRKELVDDITEIFFLRKRPSFKGKGNDMASYAWFGWPGSAEGRHEDCLRVFKVIG